MRSDRSAVPVERRSRLGWGMTGLLCPGLALCGDGAALDLTGHWAGRAALAIFAVAYALVIAEETLRLRKSKPVIVAAGAIWALVALAHADHGRSEIATLAIRQNLLEFAEVMLFLLAAMTYVNTLEERRVFQALRVWLCAAGFSLRAIFWWTGLFAFFLSPIADNLTTALVMGAVAMAAGAGHGRRGLCQHRGRGQRRRRLQPVRRVWRSWGRPVGATHFPPQMDLGHRPRICGRHLDPLLAQCGVVVTRLSFAAPPNRWKSSPLPIGPPSSGSREATAAARPRTACRARSGIWARSRAGGQQRLPPDLGRPVRHSGGGRSGRPTHRDEPWHRDPHRAAGYLGAAAPHASIQPIK